MVQSTLLFDKIKKHMQGTAPPVGKVMVLIVHIAAIYHAVDSSEERYRVRKTHSWPSEHVPFSMLQCKGTVLKVINLRN